MMCELRLGTFPACRWRVYRNFGAAHAGMASLIYTYAMLTERVSARAYRSHLPLALFLLAPLLALFAAVDPIPQDPAYHALADGRVLFGIPSFMNVVSNVGFLVAGALGLHWCLRRGASGAHRSWSVFFAGIFLVAIGSAYYHLEPDNAALVWDRLPMTLAFMGLFSALIAEHMSPQIERKLLPVAVAVGLFSVAWWNYQDDLRLYAWVQFGPLAAIVYVLLLYPGRYSHRRYLVFGLALYALSKVFELSDAAVFSATSGAISGHSLKHLIAALAPLCVYLMLRKRVAVTAP